MGDYEELRAMSRAALLDFDQAAERSIERLLVLVIPDGEIELTENPQGETVIWAYSTVATSE